MKRYTVLAALALAAALVALIASGLNSRPTSANDIAHFQTVYGTDVAAAGYGGMRGIGTGTISLAGVSGSVTKALLYWHGPTNSSDLSANASVTFAGTDITGTNIGLSDDNCWLYDNSQAYRADVTALVTGNGDYSLSNFLKDDADINGVSLIVFFDDGNDTNNRDVVLFDGNDSNIENIYDALGWNVTLADIDYDSGTAAMVLHVADGQVWLDDTLVLNGTITLEPAGHIFDGDTVPNGASAGDTGGGLWDIKSYDVTSALTPGLNTLTLTTESYEDCLSLVVAAVDLPVGAAPPPTPEPTRKHRRPSATPTEEPTATPTEVVPPPTSPPPTATQPPPPPTATPSSGVGLEIVAPPTGSGPADGGLSWTLAAWLLVGTAAAATAAGGIYLRFARR